MTCIIGYNDVENNEIHIIGDSAGINGTDIVIRSDEKVFVNGNFIIGFTTSYRMGQILQYTTFPKQLKGQTDFEYMCTDFIDTVMTEFHKKKYIKTNNSAMEGGVFLVGYRNTLYSIHKDFQVSIPTDNFYAIGCGAKYALGALHVLNALNVDIAKNLEHVMDSVVKCSGGVRPPYVWRKMKNLRKEK